MLIFEILAKRMLDFVLMEILTLGHVTFVSQVPVIPQATLQPIIPSVHGYLQKHRQIR